MQRARAAWSRETNPNRAIFFVWRGWTFINGFRVATMIHLSRACGTHGSHLLAPFLRPAAFAPAFASAAPPSLRAYSSYSPRALACPCPPCRPRYALRSFVAASTPRLQAAPGVARAPPDDPGRAAIEVPLDRIATSFLRSSGPGGQNVNKVNTRVEMRFVVDDADWIPADVRGRLHTLQRSRINKTGELVVDSQKHRTQRQNRTDCEAKLRAMLAEALIPPKKRKQRKGLSAHTKANRRDQKRKRSQVKSNRRVDKRDMR